MREKLHAYLLERPGGAAPRELLDLIFTQPGADPELGPRVLETLLGADRRFAFEMATGRWVATAHAQLARPLEETTFVAVDLETTGGAPGQGHGIIEIGAVRIRGGRVLEEFTTLVRPARRLPRFIAQLTGISAVMLDDAPPIAEALPRFAAFAAGAVLIAHNAPFDLGFLNNARLALDGEGFDQPHLCTLRLARRLLPRLRRRSLDALGGHFGVPLVDRHRALGDARITVEIFFHLLELLAARRIQRLDQLLDLQHSAADGRRFVCHLPRARVAALPHAPGVYRFTGEGGRLLYVGKAKDLRQRVGTYLVNAGAHRGKVLDLIRHIRDVTVEVAGSELEAALHEAEEIRRAKPPYNRLGKHLPQIAFLKLGTADPFPRLTIARRLGTRGGRFFGPFRGRASAQVAQGLLARLFRLRTCTGRLRPSADASPCLHGQIGACSMPCTARVDRAAYALQVAAAERFFAGDTADAEAALERRRDMHAAAQRFEAAAKAARDLELVRRMRRRHRTMSWVVARQHFAVMQPAVQGDRVLLYGIVHGRLVERTAVRDVAQLAAFADRLDGHVAAGRERSIGGEDVDGTAILAGWLRARGERDGYVFPLAGALPARGRLPEWTAALESLLTRSAGGDADPAELPAPNGP
jgi:DNA polymerase-3 subunit epsilon